MCKPRVGAKRVPRFQALIAHAFLDRLMPCLTVCTTNRHVHQDKYVENGFHLSQDVVRLYYICSEGTFYFILLTLYN